jgi:hypothetical protein
MLRNGIDRAHADTAFAVNAFFLGYCCRIIHFQRTGNAGFSTAAAPHACFIIYSD